MSFPIHSKYLVVDISDLKVPHPLTSDAYGFLFNGDMSNIEALELIYRFGIFPWDSRGKIGSFFFPKKRYIIYPDRIKIAKSIKSYFNKNKYTVSFDQNFKEVVMLCRHVKRNNQNGTWISDQFEESYQSLHSKGLAHSVEVWQEDILVGGLYGVGIGRVFTGESMFSLAPNASRFALISLAKVLRRLEFDFIDCQVINPYLSSFGGVEITGFDFLQKMKGNLFKPDFTGSWENISLNQES